MSLLKNALEKAGFKSTEPSKKKKTPSRKKSYQPRKKTHSHHKQRNTCEGCQIICPDVELYEHRNPTLQNAKWICVPCADKNMIPDDQRKTAQSESAIKGTFRRYFGRTRKFIPKSESELKENNPRINGRPADKKEGHNTRQKRNNSFQKKA